MFPRLILILFGVVVVKIKEINVKILHQDCEKSLSKNKSLPIDSYLVAYILEEETKYDIVQSVSQADILRKLKIKYNVKIVSAHRTPMRLVEFAKSAKKNNISVIIAGAGGSAHLPGMVAAITDLPIIGVPMETKSLKGLDSLLSIIQMPFGIPVGTVAIGETGAKNAALYAASILSLNDKKIANNLRIWRNKQTLSVKHSPKK